MMVRCAVMADKIDSTIARQQEAITTHRHRKRLPVSVTIDPFILHYFDKLVRSKTLFGTRSEAIEFAMWLAKKEFDKKKKTWWWHEAFSKDGQGQETQ